MSEKTKAFFKEHGYKIIGFGFCIQLLFIAYGCPSKVLSLNDEHGLVTREELQLELDNYLAKAELRFIELDKRDDFKQTIFNVALETAKGETVNPVGVIINLAAILGMGATADDIRLRRKIKKGTTS